MKNKWIIIGGIAGLLVLLGVLEIIRQSSASEEAALSADDRMSAVAERLQGYKGPENPAVAAQQADGVLDPSDNQEFDRANAILDSREESLEESKEKVNLFVREINKDR